MAKRFTDTDKWTKNKWFRKLPKDVKLFWLFICDNSDCVGVWEEDIEFVCDTVGIKAKKEDLLDHLKGQIQIIQNGKKWWIKNFCFFQYGQLKEENIKNKPHLKYISELKKHRLWIDYVKTIDSLEEEEEDKEEDMEMEEDKEEEKEKEEGVAKKKVLVTGCLFKDSEFFEKEKFFEKFKGTDYEAFNLAYYHEAVNNWSESKQETRKDWLAVARTFMLGDMKKGTAAMQNIDLLKKNTNAASTNKNNKHDRYSELEAELDSRIKGD